MDMCAVCAFALALALRIVTQQWQSIIHSFARCISICRAQERYSTWSVWSPVGFRDRPFWLSVVPSFEVRRDRIRRANYFFLNYCFTFDCIFCILLQSKSFLSLISYGIRCYTLLLLLCPLTNAMCVPIANDEFRLSHTILSHTKCTSFEWINNSFSSQNVSEFGIRVVLANWQCYV